MNQLIIYILILTFIIFLPVTSILHIIASSTKLGRLMSLPCIKFISHTSTYMIFVGLIIAETLRVGLETPLLFSNLYPQYSQILASYASNHSIKYRFPNADFFIRPRLPTILDYLCAVWIIGFFWNEVKRMFHLGIRQYFLSASNITKFIMNGLFLSAYGLKFYTMVVVTHHLNIIDGPSFWNKITNLQLNDYATQKECYESIYWLNADRFYWNPFDPVNLSEGLFSIGIIFAFANICFLLPALEVVGPLQITLGKMIIDVVKFVMIFIIIFVGFLFGVSTLFAYYNKSVRSTVELIDHYAAEPTQAEIHFSTITGTLNTFFWSIFGIENGNEATMNGNNSNIVPQTIGNFLYGALHIASIVMLLNMLIAMMTKSYESIRAASDVEWKFARSQLYMEYINEGSTLPSPLNIIPTPKGMILLAKRLNDFLKRRRGQSSLTDKDSNNTSHKYSHPARRPKSMNVLLNDNRRSKTSHMYGDDDLTYKKVMQRVIKRFLLRSQRENEKGEEGDLEQIKQDLQMVRFEMHNDLKRARLKTLKSLSYIHGGLSAMGDEVIKSTQSITNSEKFYEFKSYENDLNEILSEFNTN